MVKKSMPARTDMCDAMNSLQVVFWLRFGAGAMPSRRRTFPIVPSDTQYRRLDSAPTIRSYPHPEFSRAI